MIVIKYIAVLPSSLGLFECGGVTARDLGTVLSIYRSQRVGTLGSFGNRKSTGGRQSIPCAIYGKQF